MLKLVPLLDLCLKAVSVLLSFAPFELLGLGFLAQCLLVHLLGCMHLHIFLLSLFLLVSLHLLLVQVHQPCLQGLLLLPHLVLYAIDLFHLMVLLRGFIAPHYPVQFLLLVPELDVLLELVQVLALALAGKLTVQLLLLLVLLLLVLDHCRPLVYLA